MRTRNLTTIIVASSLMLPLSAFAGSGSKEDKRDQDRSSASTWSETQSASSSSFADIKRVDKDKLDSKMTAKELIGKEVVDMNGERLGSIHDIGLAQVLPSEFRDADSSDAAPQTTGLSSMQPGNHLNLYVAVGGVLGVGADIVSVPAERFGFDRENDRLTLDISEDQFSAIADPDGDRSGFAAATTADVTTPGYASGATGATPWVGSTPAPATTAGQEGLTGTRTDTAFASDQEDVRKIERAFNDNDELSDIASQIVVAQSGDAILLSGAVNDESQKERAIKLARENTSKEVRDYLRVASAAE